MKRILGFVLLCVGVLGMTTAALADDDELTAFVKKLSEPGAPTTLTLQNNVTLSATVEIGTDKSIIIDLNGKNITCSSRAIHIKSGDVTIRGEGTITASPGSWSSVIRVGDAQSNAAIARLTVEKGVTVSSTKEETYGITVFGTNIGPNSLGQELIFNGKIDVADACTISGNGTSTLSKTRIIIGSDAELIARSGDAIYHPQMGDLIVQGGEITGKSGIEMKSGNLTINGGTITATQRPPQDPIGNSSGTSSGGYAVAVLLNKSYRGGNGLIDIKGGNFTGPVAIAGDDGKTDGAKYTPSMTVSGGTFSERYEKVSNDWSGCVASGYKITTTTVDDRELYKVIVDAPDAEEAQKKTEELNKAIDSDENLKDTPLGDALKSVLNDTTATNTANASDEEVAQAVTKAEVVSNIMDTLANDSELSKELNSSGSGEEATKELIALITTAINNKLSEDQAAKEEAASGEVKDTKVPAGTDLLAETKNEALQKANANLSTQPKVITPTAITTESAKTMANNLSLLETSKVKDTGIDAAALEKIKAAAENLQPAASIEIEDASSDVAAQAEILEAVFDEVSENLVNAPNAGGGTGVVIASVLPKMTPRVSGFFPLKINLRNLIFGRKLKFWPSTGYFNNMADSASASSVSLAADDENEGDNEGKEGDFFFLDGDQNPVTKVTGDASNMTVVAYLEQGKDYDTAFITADATDEEKEVLTTLAEETGGSSNNGGDNNSGGNDNNGGGGDSTDNNNGGGGSDNNGGSGDDGKGGTDDGSGDSDSSSGSGGGCEVSFGLWSLAALMTLATISKKR